MCDFDTIHSTDSQHASILSTNSTKDEIHDNTITIVHNDILTITKDELFALCNEVYTTWFKNPCDWFGVVKKFDWVGNFGKYFETIYISNLHDMFIDLKIQNIMTHITCDKQIIIGFILLIDQISRHIIPKCDSYKFNALASTFNIIDIATKLYYNSCEIQQSKYILTPDEFCFIMLPLRHSRKIEHIFMVMHETWKRVIALINPKPMQCITNKINDFDKHNTIDTNDDANDDVNDDTNGNTNGNTNCDTNGDTNNEIEINIYIRFLKATYTNYIIQVDDLPNLKRYMPYEYYDHHETPEKYPINFNIFKSIVDKDSYSQTVSSNAVDKDIWIPDEFIMVTNNDDIIMIGNEDDNDSNNNSDSDNDNGNDDNSDNGNNDNSEIKTDTNNAIIILNQNISKQLALMINEFPEYADKSLPIILSLSGGVDSMCLIYWLVKSGYTNVVAVHISYQNRKVCDTEIELLKMFCAWLNVRLYVRKINEINRKNATDIGMRNTYEVYTRKIRFIAYTNAFNDVLEHLYAIGTFDLDMKNTLSKIGPMVFMGHNRDDKFENVLTNILTESHYDDLTGFKLTTRLNNVNIIRPMMDIDKLNHYRFAQAHKIPYLPNSTPSYSQRGQIRNVIRPVLMKWNKKSVDSFFALSSRMREMSELIDILIARDKINTHYGQNIQIDMDNINVNRCYWSKLFNEFQCIMSPKSIDNFICMITSVAVRIKKNDKRIKCNQLNKINLTKKFQIIWKWNGANIITMKLTNII